MKTIDQQIDSLIPAWEELIAALIPDIADDYRASDDPWDYTPSMCLTVEFTPADDDSEASWSYQTGDNSFTGGTYGHRHWGVVTLCRDSSPAELAADIADQLSESCAYYSFTLARQNKQSK